VLGKEAEAYFVLPHSAPERANFLNLSEVEIREPANLNAYRVLAAKKLLFTETALTEFITLFKHE